MLIGTDVCVRMVFMWEEIVMPGGNPPVWLGDHMTISHADAGYDCFRSVYVSTAFSLEIDLLYGCFYFGYFFAGSFKLQVRHNGNEVIGHTEQTLFFTEWHV